MSFPFRLFLACVVLATLLPLAGQTPDSGQPALPKVFSSILITAAPLEPGIDLRNASVFQESLFSRDDQVFHQLNAGINAGQHEGGGKSIEIRRFGFNLDHGGVNGGLKILIDNIQQNQGTQGHGQGYLGSLKSLAPELVQEAQLINGPFSAQYGDFSGLGVVHIRLRESLPDELTVRVQGGSFNTKRGFLAWSPAIKSLDSFIAYDGSHSDGPFLKPLDYRRDYLTANFTRRLNERQSLAFKLSGGRHRFNSSGQIPLAEVAAGRLDRFGFLDPGDGGANQSGTAALYYSRENQDGSLWKLDGFVSRSLFDLYSNFTFFLHDQVAGDGIQQHDSRLQQGANAQYLKPHRWGGVTGYLIAGGNYHDNQINVGLYPRIGRTATGASTLANVRVLNGAGYLQDSLSFWSGRMMMEGGLRYDLFRYDIRDRLTPIESAVQDAGRWQPKFGWSLTPSHRLPVTLHFNYGRGISSLDARSITRAPGRARLATTDFYQTGISARAGRAAFTLSSFLIDRSNELVYVADDGSFELLGRSRSYGGEAKMSVQLTRALSFTGGVTRVSNAFYRGTSPRSYVYRAPHFVADSSLTLSGWRGWIGSFRMRAINSYRLDGEDAGIRAAGQTVFDWNVVRRISRSVDFNFAIDNLFDRRYFETQNFVESRPYAGGAAMSGIHGTPGYSRTFTAGLTARFGRK